MSPVVATKSTVGGAATVVVDTFPATFPATFGATGTTVTATKATVGP